MAKRLTTLRCRPLNLVAGACWQKPTEWHQRFFARGVSEDNVYTIYYELDGIERRLPVVFAEKQAALQNACELVRAGYRVFKVQGAGFIIGAAAIEDYRRAHSQRQDLACKGNKRQRDKGNKTQRDKSGRYMAMTSGGEGAGAAQAMREG
jgi:hypothetical protein